MLSSFSALDAYFCVPSAPLRFVHIQGGLVELAAAYDNLSYPGLPYADAAGLEVGAGTALRFQCSDGDYQPAFLPLAQLHDPAAHWFGAKGGVYQSLRVRTQLPHSAPDELVLFEAAVLASRYPYDIRESIRTAAPGLSAAYQRDLLDLILTGARPERGLDYLRSCGFLDAYWPELAGLCTVDHVKDYHPEGDAWRHTLETFSHRKSPDHILSLALLLHDAGKPDAVSVGGRRFDRHSELGERSARSFLKR
ncbi:MAG TPA: phosphohydrolase, partial [Spirochaetales bacterium]|nr:phosphohydrolase [Spirochaetales bacterium]